MPYMDIIRAVHCSLNIPYLCPQYVSFTPSEDQSRAVHVTKLEANKYGD